MLSCLVELMVDPFGNYLIQKLLDRCSEDQRFQARTCTVQEPAQACPAVCWDWQCDSPTSNSSCSQPIA